jgi:hypothetical protein
MALKKGTWVKLKGYETYGVIVEHCKGDAELTLRWGCSLMAQRTR